MRLSELYTSVQGEGPNTGKLEQFIRFGGCNMRCPGWPCDTQYAIDPEYRETWKPLSVAELCEQVESFPRHVCLTGGEPLIQRKSDMEEFGDRLLVNGYRIDLFTNGSQEFPPWFSDPKVTIVMDWKLDGSGERFTGIVQRRENLNYLTSKDCVKFVVKDRTDLIRSLQLWTEWSEMPIQIPIFIGKVWDGETTDEDIVKFMIEHQVPWKLNVQTHKYIWSPTMRGV